MAKGSRAFDYMVFNDELERAVGEIAGAADQQPACARGEAGLAGTGGLRF